MKDLFKKYSGTNRGYSLNELRARMSELSGKSQARFYSDFIVGTREFPITDYFQMAGIKATISDGNLMLSKKDDATARQRAMLSGMFGEENGKNQRCQ